MDNEKKVFYCITGPHGTEFININYVIEWQESNNHLRIYFTTGLAYEICRDYHPRSYDALLHALKERTNWI